MSRYEDLIGKRYGRLVVTSLLPSDGRGHRRWVCRCDCGKIHTATTGNLNSGHVTSCGCHRSPDLTGQVIGKLTVLGRASEPSEVGAPVLWECRCECGATVLRTSETLSADKERSCLACAQRQSAAMALQSAGFVNGTQLTKLTDMTPGVANTSGCRGVYYHKKQKKWCARLRFRGKLMSFGSYDSFEDAVKARKRAEEEIFGAFLEEMA